MKRRLFEDLVVSARASGRRGRGWVFTASTALHAMVVGGLLVVPALRSGELPQPVPPSGRIVDVALPTPPASSPPPQIDARPPRQGPRRSGGSPQPPTIYHPGESEHPDDRGPVTDGTPICFDCTAEPPADPGGDATPGALTDAPPQRIVLSPTIRPPVKLRHVPPAYPEIAKAAHVQGVVVLECVVGRDGHVLELRVLSGPTLLRDAATDAVRQWAYTPTLLNGVPVEVLMNVTVKFILDR